MFKLVFYKLSSKSSFDYSKARFSLQRSNRSNQSFNTESLVLPSICSLQKCLNCNYPLNFEKLRLKKEKKKINIG